VHPYLRRTPVLIVLSGPSGVGKDAMLNKMRLMALPIHFTVTATTRQKRQNETEGVDYHFLARETFEEMIKRGEFLEYANVYGNWYGVPKAQVHNALAGGKDVIIKADVQGAATIKKAVPQAVMTFVVPPSMPELERRLRWRMTESDTSLRTRLDTARQEMERIVEFDFAIVNDSLDQAVHELLSVVNAERCRIPPKPIKL